METKVTRAVVYDSPWPKVKAGVGSRLPTRRLPHRRKHSNVRGSSLRVLA
ncbi:MAG: hypothetical protein AVDCRST_MAG75-299 [uncultured Propionibacteriaceae bacterium]|uniref:Uncharacterized protein n=1 Tax=uncultured Propionibacteriaceae bacterium TaxID=257457 RepID=A0A6J4N2V0_9ACTN|nr:MAG: hypothetical protein AVDCRST_MAG75-299 [uncultured Propionibacteriaceae bacterium]